MARRDLNLVDNPGPADTGMQAKSIKGSSREMIPSLSGFPFKSLAARSSTELADGNGDTIDDSQVGFTLDSGLEPVPESLFHPIEVGGLAHKRGAMHATEAREVGQVMALKIRKDRGILIQSKIFSHEFHGQYFTVCQAGRRPTLAESFTLQNRLHPIINETKPRHQEIIKLHRWPPQGISDSLSLSASFSGEKHARRVMLT
jgi:hypothetical protein